MSDIVYAKTNCTLAHGGQRYRVSGGEPWRASDPLVARYPDSFTGDLSAVRSSEDPRGWTEYEPPVERATAAPGEKRAARRRRATEDTGAGDDE